MKSCYALFLFWIFGLASCTSAPNIPSTSITASSPSSISIFTPTEKPTATFTITSSPTVNPYPTVINSPNSKFSARLHIFWNGMSEYDKPVIEISDQSGTNLWTIPYQYEWNPLSGIPKSMTIQGWSPDSSKVYFYYSLQYDSGLPTLASARNLQSLDIHTGKIMAVLPLKPDEPTAFAFSPTISTIAYISGNSINIIDISSGAEKHAKILTDNFDDAGWIFYSPSGNKIIYHTLVSQNYFAAILEPQTMRQEIIYEWADYFLVNYAFDGWTLDEWPRYRDYKNNVSVIDLNTLSQTMIGTATPKP